MTHSSCNILGLIITAIAENVLCENGKDKYFDLKSISNLELSYFDKVKMFGKMDSCCLHNRICPAVDQTP